MKYFAGIIALLTLAVLVSPVLAGGPPGCPSGYSCPGDPASITTLASIDGSGSPPTVEYVWVLPDEDPLTSGTQLWPALSDTRNDIYACIVVSDPQGRDDIQNVYVDVYHPNGSFKYQVHAVKLDIDQDEEEIEDCKLDALEAGLITQEQFDEINYQIFDQPAWYMYKVYLPMLYHQPAGEYEARAWATDTSSEVSDTLSAYFDWVSTVAVELGFSTLDFGLIQPSVYKVIQGDYDMATYDAPTLKNEGNEPAEISVVFTNMTGNIHNKIIDDFDAQFRAEHLFFESDETVTFENPLELCHQEKIDFSVHADVGTPTDTYVGTVTIYAAAYE